jgi:hypothetical protein
MTEIDRNIRIALIVAIVVILLLRVVVAKVNPIKGVAVFYKQYPKTPKGQYAFLKSYWMLLKIAKKHSHTGTILIKQRNGIQ